MAKTFKIALSPTFTATVNIPRVGADDIAVPFKFKTMDRKQLANMFTEWNKAQTELIESSENYDLADWTSKEIELQVNQIKHIVVGWGIEDEFNDENIEALVTTAISVTSVITEVYSEAYTRAKKGN